MGKKSPETKTEGENSGKVEFSHKDEFHVKCNCHIRFYFKASISILYSRFISQPKIQSNVMADLCFICDKPLSESDTVNVVRGLQTLKTASIARNDGNIGYLNTLNSVNVHTECRKVYISKNSITASKRRQTERQPSLSPNPPRKKRNETFDFKTLCIFCGEVANEATEIKRIEKYKRPISKVSTLEFKDNIIKKADERDDFLGKLVKDRIICTRFDSCRSKIPQNLPC